MCNVRGRFEGCGNRTLGSSSLERVADTGKDLQLKDMAGYGSYVWLLIESIDTDHRIFCSY